MLPKRTEHIDANRDHRGCTDGDCFRHLPSYCAGLTCKRASPADSPQKSCPNACPAAAANSALSALRACNAKQQGGRTERGVRHVFVPQLQDCHYFFPPAEESQAAAMNAA